MRYIIECDNPNSGTKPSEFRQSWFIGLEKEGEDCIYYWPKGDQK